MGVIKMDDSLFDQLKNLLGQQVLALAAFGWAVAWATAQNFFDKLSAPTIVGPGKADILRYGMDILQADDPKGACKAAADGIYNLLLPNFGDIMGGPVSAVTDLIGTGDNIGNSVSSDAVGGSDSSVFTGQAQHTGISPSDIYKPDEETEDEND
jgi:hypothetical protein